MLRWRLVFGDVQFKVIFWNVGTWSVAQSLDPSIPPGLPRMVRMLGYVSSHGLDKKQ